MFKYKDKDAAFFIWRDGADYTLSPTFLDIPEPYQDRSANTLEYRVAFQGESVRFTTRCDLDDFKFSFWNTEAGLTNPVDLDSDIAVSCDSGYTRSFYNVKVLL